MLVSKNTLKEDSNLVPDLYVSIEVSAIYNTGASWFLSCYCGKKYFVHVHFYLFTFTFVSVRKST